MSGNDLGGKDLEVLTALVHQVQATIPPEYQRDDSFDTLRQQFIDNTFRYWNTSRMDNPKHDLVSEKVRKRKATEMPAGDTKAPVTPKKIKVAEGAIPSPSPSPKAQPVNSVRALKRKGAVAYCRPELADATINFRFIDGEGSYHLTRDIEFDGGKFTGDMRRNACFKWDCAQLQSLGTFNNDLVVFKFRRWLHVKYHYRGCMDDAPADVEFREVELQTPVWDACIETIKATHDNPPLPQTPFPRT
ncbi:hypothetical protein PFICI_13736 [Pestalotiopsis fici W106-1]|uniref:Uncharacterized protein n=1 Tax=Pestalotiopsis fici (strain W106-1 / CGMCC3.15140) TaxID=1229662 RepID=W3WQ50_PESFW|nr:uncharacterized protein PFICI_13736 [Pestalotiopsis fici W106-1]ETS75252.1 hypothetical protein PFICI_13736 [Pestalotiopsis fici W106-1]